MRNLSEVICVGLVLVSSIPIASNVGAQSERHRSDSSRAIPSFGVIECNVGTPVVVAHDSKANVERSFIPVEVPATGDSIVVDLAELVFTASTRYDTTQALLVVVSPATIAATSRPSTWQEDWTDMSGGFDAEYIATATMDSTQSEVEFRLDVTEMVRRWTTSEMPNYGFVLKSLSDDKSTVRLVRDGRYNGQDAKLEIYYSRNPLALR